MCAKFPKSLAEYCRTLVYATWKVIKKQEMILIVLIMFIMIIIIMTITVMITALRTRAITMMMRR